MTGGSVAFRTWACAAGSGLPVAWESYGGAPRSLWPGPGPLGTSWQGFRRPAEERQAQIRLAGLSRFDTAPCHIGLGGGQAAAVSIGLRLRIIRDEDPGPRRVNHPIYVGLRRHGRQAFPEGGTTHRQPLERLLTEITVLDVRQDDGQVIGTERLVEEILQLIRAGTRIHV